MRLFLAPAKTRMNSLLWSCRPVSSQSPRVLSTHASYCNTSLQNGKEIIFCCFIYLRPGDHYPQLKTSKYVSSMHPLTNLTYATALYFHISF